MPTLGLAQRPGLGKQYPIADGADVFLIMGQKFVLPADIFLVRRVFDEPFDNNHHGLFHFVADDGSDHLSFHSSYFHMRP